MHLNILFLLLVASTTAKFWDEEDRPQNLDELREQFRNHFKPIQNYWNQASKQGSCAAQIDEKIVGGVEADHGEIPWQVSIQSGSKTHFCGGAILDNQWILTAAHCVHEARASQLKVVAGEHNLEKSDGREQTRQVNKIIIHEGYDSKVYHNDIALLQLSEPLKLDGDSAGHICLPEMYQESEGDCTVSGWGTLSEDSDSVSIVLNKVTVPIVSDAECIRSYWGIVPIQRHMLCAGFEEGGKDSCQGDSGGPLVCLTDSQNFYLAGVVSFGNGCAQEGYFGVYTQVSYFVTWIEKNADINPSKIDYEDNEDERVEVKDDNEDETINYDEYEGKESSRDNASSSLTHSILMLCFVLLLL